MTPNDLTRPRPIAGPSPRRRELLQGVALLALLAGCSTTRAPGPAATPTPEAAAPSPTPPPVSAPPIAAPARLPRIGLALGGGAARGFAHIGVIEVLEENHIHVDLVAGTSAGSVVAALYASGKSGAELARLADSMDETAFTDWDFPGRALIRGEALARYVREQTGKRNIEQMPMPLGIVATDLDSGQAILFQRGDTGLAVRASSAVPAVFQPVKIGKREYVDGGLVAPVPVHFARQMGADLVIAVDISSPPDGNATSDVMRMLLQTFSIMGRSINAFELRDADVLVRPKLLGISSADFSARKRSIQAGREAALAALPSLKARVAALMH